MITLLLTIVLVVLVCAVAVWVLGQLAPGHPQLIDAVIWVFCVLSVLLILMRAFGIVDIPVPKLR